MDRDNPARQKRAILAGIAGNVMEWYDFTAYGYFAAVSDRLGRKPVLLAATAGTLVMAWPLFWMMHHTNSWVILLGQLGFAVLSACFWGAASTAMVELVPDRFRCTVLSFGYNLGMTVLGGLTPMVAGYTIK